MNSAIYVKVQFKFGRRLNRQPMQWFEQGPWFWNLTWSIVTRIRLRSQIWQTADLHIFDTCFSNEKAGSKATPSFCTESITATFWFRSSTGKIWETFLRWVKSNLIYNKIASRLMDFTIQMRVIHCAVLSPFNGSWNYALASVSSNKGGSG